MTEFFPNIQSRWIKLVVFIGSLVGIFGKKYLDHLEQIKKESPQKIPTEGSNGSSPAPSETTVLSLGQTVPINPAKRF